MDSMNTNARKPPRSYNWTFLLYPDSCGDKLVVAVKLLSLRVPCILSPLHCPDNADDENAEALKEHWHCMLMFSTLKSQAQVLRLVQDVFGKVLIPKDDIYEEHNVVSKVFPVSDKVSMLRYFVHFDQPEKQQFPLDELHKRPYDFLTLFNLPIEYTSTLDRIFKQFHKEVDETLIELIEFINSSMITSFSDLVNTLLSLERYDLFRTAKSNSNFVLTYLKSYNYSLSCLTKETFDYERKKI